MLSPGKTKLEYETSTSVSVGEAWLGNPEMAAEGGLHGLRVALLPHHKFPRRCDETSAATAVVLHCYTEKTGEAKEVLLKQQGAWRLSDGWENSILKGMKAAWLAEAEAMRMRRAGGGE